MKKIANIHFCILISTIFLGSCQEKPEWEVTVSLEFDNEDKAIKEKKRFDFEEILPVSESSGAQGGDCWGDFFFQFVANNSIVRVYDLSLKTLVQTIRIPTSEKGFVYNCHCNTVCFGTEYYDTEDIFPLIYVSTGYASNGYTGALVYRIISDQGTFSIKLVQTLKFPADESSWTEFVPGDEYAYLCYTSERVIFKVPMPKLKDGNVVVINRNAALETYQFTPQPDWMSSSRNQDRLFYQGKILLVSGVPQDGEASVFVILNLETRERERIEDFKEIRLNNESESIFVWRGDICVAFIDRIVKLIL